MAGEVLFGLVGILLLLVLLLALKIRSMQRSLEALAFGKKSLSVKYGKMSEQFFPFLKDYPYNPQEFRFLGSPIDGIQFEKDKIVLVEFKAGDSSLSKRQAEIKNLVEKKRVEFEEVRIG